MTLIKQLLFLSPRTLHKLWEYSRYYTTYITQTWTAAILSSGNYKIRQYLLLKPI